VQLYFWESLQDGDVLLAGCREKNMHNPDVEKSITMSCKNFFMNLRAKLDISCSQPNKNLNTLEMRKCIYIYIFNISYKLISVYGI